MTKNRKKNLVICVAGDLSYHTRWCELKKKGFDLMLIYYGNTKDKYKQDADYYLQTSGMFKLENIAFAVNKYYDIVKNYDAVFLPDDDMDISVSSINFLFKVFYKYGLDLAQPTICSGLIPHSIGKTVPGHILRYSSSVDMGCPIFKTQVLLEMLPLFTLNRSGWGIDRLWSERCKDKKMAMIDCVSLSHKGGLAENYRKRAYYKKIAEAGVDEIRDLSFIIAQYNLKHKEKVYKAVKFPFPLFFLMRIKQFMLDFKLQDLVEIKLLEFYIKLLKHRWMMKLIWRKGYYPFLVKLPLKTFEAVYKFYLLESQRLIDFEVHQAHDSKVVLKTDLYNEAGLISDTKNIIGNLKRTGEVHAIEIQENVRQKAEVALRKTKISNCFLKAGDIRDLPYANDTFDVILDLSTIDHVKPDELGAVFSEYERVLKRAGAMLLIAWIDISNPDAGNIERINDRSSGYQYFFNKEEFLKTLRKHFAIERENTIFYWPDNNNYRLVRFVCSKNTVWQYLLTGGMDSRIELVSEYLKDKVKDRVIVDLDCGHAPLLKYLPDTYKQYIGNDIRDIFPAERNDKCIFYLKKDDELINILTKIDILVALGLGGHEISKEPRESKTCTQTLKRIISKLTPEIVVLEAVNRFLPVLESVEKCAFRYSYKTKHHLDIKPDKDRDWVKHRTLLILEKKHNH